MEVAEVVDALSTGTQTKPRITIISGKTCIKLSPPYNQGIRRTADETEKRLQFFNEANSSLQPPDKKHVLELQRPFPGTIISVRFGIGPNHITRNPQMTLGV